MANELLLDSYRMKLGAWQTIQDGETYLAVFAAKVSAELDSDSLETILESISSSADEMEQKITDADEF